MLVKKIYWTLKCKPIHHVCHNKNSLWYKKKRSFSLKYMPTLIRQYMSFTFLSLLMKQEASLPLLIKMRIKQVRVWPETWNYILLCSDCAGNSDTGWLKQTTQLLGTLFRWQTLALQRVFSQFKVSTLVKRTPVWDPGVVDRRLQLCSIEAREEQWGLT